MNLSSKDQNFVNTLTGTLNTDGRTVVPVKVTVSTSSLKVNDGFLGSNNGPTNATRDANNVPTLLAVSEVDGVTPVVIYADSTGSLFIDSS